MQRPRLEMTTGLWLALVIVLAVLTVALLPQPSPSGRQAGAPNPPATASDVFYWTTPGVEPDTGVAGWLLTRFVTPGARVEIAEHSASGIPFDLPGCQLQRQVGKSTSEVVLETYAVTHPLALAVVDVVRELELNPWTTMDDDFFLHVRSGLAEAVNASDADIVCLERMMAFLDTLPAPPRHSTRNNPPK